MNTKTKALTLLSVLVVAVVAGSFIFIAQSTVKADPNASVAADSETTLSSVNATDNGQIGFNGPMAMGMGRGRPGEMMHRGMDRGFGVIQVSTDFTENVTNIATNDSDVQNLLNQGFNITSIRPIISTVVDGNGNVVTKASTANVLLQGNNVSRAFAVVDLTQLKVTKLVTMTITEIDK